MKKQYYSISEVSKLLNIKEHVIRHWDSVDPKTKKYRIANLSTRTKGGTRFFNESQIKKIEKITNTLRENGRRSNSLDLVSKIISQNTNKSSNNLENKDNTYDSLSIINKIDKIKKIRKNLKTLINTK